MEDTGPVRDQGFWRPVVLSVLGLAAFVVVVWAWASHVEGRESARRAVRLARYAYSLTVKLHLKADRDKDEHAFMEACKLCASAQECERDRLVIATGRASDDYNPCD